MSQFKYMGSGGAFLFCVLLFASGVATISKG